MLYCIRYSKERPKFVSKYKTKNNETGKPHLTSDDVMHDELSKQKEFLETGNDDKRLLRGSTVTPVVVDTSQGQTAALQPGYYERGISFISIATDEKHDKEATVEHSKVNQSNY